MLNLVRHRMPILGQLARFGVVGLSLNAALYVVYIGLTGAGLAPPVASSAVFLAGIPLSLLAHGRFTFRVPDVGLAQKLRFAGGYLAGYAIQIGLLVSLYRGVGLPHQLSQLCAMVAVAAFLFVFQRTLVFKQ